MLLANKKAVMAEHDTLNFVVFNPLQNSNPIAVRRRKLITKIDEKPNLQLIKSTQIRRINGLLTKMVANAKYKLPSV